MKKLRTILAALATLRRVPSAAIHNSWCEIKSEVIGESGDSHADALELIDAIIGAVVSLAKDDEDKAAAPGKSDKP